MSQTYTTNYNLGKWEDGDNPGATQLNLNWTTIDEQLFESEEQILNLDDDVQVDLNALAAQTLLPTVAPKTTAYSVVQSDNRKTFTNAGAGAQVIFTLPPAPAVGTTVSFVVLAAQNVRLAPGNATDLIRVAASVSTVSSGHIDNATIGGVVTLLYVAAALWIATSQEGTWTVT